MKSVQIKTSTKQNPKMKTQIEITPGLASRRGLNTPTAVASPALATTTIPAGAGGRSETVIEEDPDAIRPFRVNVPEAELTDLRRRIKATRFPEKETVADFSQGVQLAFIQALARYWATDYNWRRCEAQLNARPQFITEIDGLDIHFRSEEHTSE